MKSPLLSPAMTRGLGTWHGIDGEVAPGFWQLGRECTSGIIPTSRA